MYKSRRGVDRSHLGNRRKKGAVVFCFFFFSSWFWELSSESQGGRREVSQQSGQWCLETLPRWETARGGYWLMQAHLGPTSRSFCS